MTSISKVYTLLKAASVEIGFLRMFSMKGHRYQNFICLVKSFRKIEIVDRIVRNANRDRTEQIIHETLRRKRDMYFFLILRSGQNMR